MRSPRPALTQTPPLPCPLHHYLLRHVVEFLSQEGGVHAVPIGSERSPGTPPPPTLPPAQARGGVPLSGGRGQRSPHAVRRDRPTSRRRHHPLYGHCR